MIEGFTLTNGTGTYYAPWNCHCGGGVFCDPTSCPTIRNNNICGNTLPTGESGGVCSFNAVITDNKIFDNVAGCKVMRYGGGGILCIDYAEVTKINNFIMNNISELEGGGGISCRNSSPILLNNFICNNSAESGGGIDVFEYSSVTMTSNTPYGNHASKGGSIACRFNSSSVITDTILWQNIAAIGPEIYIAGTSYPSTVTISYSDLKGGQADVYIFSILLKLLCRSHTANIATVNRSLA